MNPEVSVPIRSTLTNRIIPLLHTNLKDAMDTLMNKELEHVAGVGFTCDIFSHAEHSFMSLTMQFIDRQWQLHRLVMDCCRLDEQHSLGEKVDEMIATIGLPTAAPITLVTDGGSSLVRPLRDSASDHLICACCIISECLKDAFEVPEMKAAVEKLGEFASATRKSLQLTLEIKKECQELNGNGNS